MALSLEYWRIYVDSMTKIARKSEDMVEANRVLSFTYDTDYMVVSAHVQASMRDQSYKIQVTLDTEGHIRESSCECPMRNFKCSHVAAALLYGFKNVSKTSVKCSWVKHPKSIHVDTQTVLDMFPSNQPQYRALRQPFSNEDRACLYQDLHSLGRYTALHWILSPEPEDCSILPVSLVEDLIMSEGYLGSSSPMDWLRVVLAVTREQITLTAEKTKGQRDNAFWSAVRKYRFTASNFCEIIKAANKNRLTNTLTKKLLSPYNLEKVASVHWGVIHEQSAIESYVNKGAKVTQTGIWLHASGVLAASPDGLVTDGPTVNVHGNNHVMPQLLEVKCPYAARDMTIVQAVESIPDFCLGGNKYALHLKQDHPYWHQIQGQLHITELVVCDLVVWTNIDMQIIRVQKDITWSTNLSRMIAFYFDKFLPIIVNN